MIVIIFYLEKKYGCDREYSQTKKCTTFMLLSIFLK